MRKSVLTAMLTVLVAAVVAGCGASSYVEETSMTTEASTQAYDSAAAYAEPAEAAEAAWEESGAIAAGSGLESVQSTSQKLIKTVNLEIQTLEFDSVTDSLGQKVKELGGYVESSSIWGNSYSSQNRRSADYTVRIPSDKLDEFVEEASGLGNVTYKNESVEDVTLQYVDTESRKKALEATQDRLLELLEQAESMEDILTIESKLSEIRYELENYGSQLRVLDNQIDYSTVYITISEVEVITPVGEKGFFEEVADRFGNSLYRVGRGARGFAIGLLGNLPVLVVWALILFVIVVLIRKLLKRSGKRTRKDQLPPQDEKKV